MSARLWPDLKFRSSCRYYMRINSIIFGHPVISENRIWNCIYHSYLWSKQFWQNFLQPLFLNILCQDFPFHVLFGPSNNRLPAANSMLLIFLCQIPVHFWAIYSAKQSVEASKRVIRKPNSELDFIFKMWCI